MDINQIQELIRLVSKSKIAELILKEGDFEIVIRNQTMPEPSPGPGPAVVAFPPPVVNMPGAAPMLPPPPPVAPAAVPAAPPAAEAPTSEPAPTGNLLTIKSPMVGTFYRAPGPDKPPFVKVGDTVDVGTKVCIIEAMKLFNEIESEVKGKIAKVLVEDASPVEYDQPLFLVEPL
ncbi:MAG: acetyl-CoA carboxylase biotin carboxyl carrier protein [Saprospiraceae bacterium]|nr:acetyl-CoA carboxylase biotin carboxyl carrier protein [Saprospiraceae bacterium]MDW8230583.1 acetyl-CoA carboxylase biotin carboxyl carrier protein [Saprospiraceae bacterium]